MKIILNYTQKSHKELINITRSLTEENIKNIFIMSPKWKSLFLSKFPNYIPENYVENAWSILLDNGYTYTTERMRSKKFNCIVRGDVFKGPVEKDDFIIGTDFLHETSFLINLLSITLEEIDLNDLK